MLFAFTFVDVSYQTSAFPTKFRRGKENQPDVAGVVKNLSQVHIGTGASSLFVTFLFCVALCEDGGFFTSVYECETWPGLFQAVEPGV